MPVEFDRLCSSSRVVTAIDPVNRMLFAFASYNAGPNRIARLRGQAGEYGLNPNEWFGEVELIVQRKVGMEPVNYVRNIYKYYLGYMLVLILHHI